MASARKYLFAALAVALVPAGTAAALQAAAPPPPELKKLEFLAGKPSGKGKMFVPGQPPADWTAADSSAWIMDGHYLRIESKTVYQGGITDLSSALMGYDPQEKVYRLWRFTTMQPTPIEASGKFEGSKLVMQVKPADQGEIYRITFDSKSKSEYSFLLEQKMGDKWVKFLEGTFTTQK